MPKYGASHARMTLVPAFFRICLWNIPRNHLTGLRDSCNAYIDAGNGIPCGEVGDAGDGQGKYPLEDADCLRRARTINTVGNNGGDGGIIAGNPVELLLELAYLVARGAYG